MSDLNIRQSAKDFLTSTEQQMGGTFTLLVGLLVAFGLYAARGPILGLFDFAIEAVGRAIVLGALGLVGVWLVMLAMNPRTYTEMWHLQNRVAKWVSGWAMRSDPFGRMRAFADEFLGEQYEKFNQAATRIEAQLHTTRASIAKHEEALEESNAMVAAIKKRHMSPGGVWSSDEHRDAFRLESQRILLTEETLKKSRKNELKLATLVKIVDRWRNTFKFEIESTRMSADFLEMQFHQANETAGALKSAATVFGHGDMAKADKEVREYIEKLTANRIAESDVLMKQIPELTALGDLQGDAAEDEVMDRLRELDAASQRAFVEVQNDHKLIEAGGTEKITEVVKTKTAETQPVRRYLSR